MSNIDLSLAGSYLQESDDLSKLETFLVATDDFSRISMNSALSALFGRVGESLKINRDTYDQLSNLNKFFLVRGALPERETEIRAFVLERFYKFVS